MSQATENYLDNQEEISEIVDRSEDYSDFEDMYNTITEKLIERVIAVEK